MRVVGATVKIIESPGLDWILAFCAGDPVERVFLEDVARRGGTPIIFPSRATHDDVVGAYAQIAGAVDRFYGFELSPVFHPDGRIWDLATFREVLDIPQCVGAKHSSLHRQPEWDRLDLRDDVAASRVRRCAGRRELGVHRSCCRLSDGLEGAGRLLVVWRLG